MFKSFVKSDLLKSSLFLVSILFCLSFTTHFLYFGHPSEVVFDEIYYGQSASHYIVGESWFSGHPPFGQVLLGAVGSFGEGNNSGAFGKIGDNLSGTNFRWLRLLPTVAGTILPIIIFFLCLELGLPKMSSFLAGLAVILENSLLLESRLVLLDIFLVFFGFLGLYLYLLSRRKKSLFLLCCALASVTSAIAIKWTGVSFLALIWCLEFFKFLKFKKFQTVTFQKISKAILLYAIFPFAIYFCLFIPYYLRVEQNLSASGAIQSFVDNNKHLWDYQSTLKEPHPYQSNWYEWPIMKRPIFYWTLKDTKNPAYIYLIGNPFIYWFSSLAFLWFFVSFVWKKLIKKCTNINQTDLFLILGFLGNLLPFVLISRLLFLYHYLPALIFSIICLAFWLEKIRIKKWGVFTIITIFILFTTSFLYFSPLTYGIPLSPDAMSQRFWFGSWK